MKAWLTGFLLLLATSARTFIFSLFAPRGPSAIPWLIVALVIDSIKGQSWWKFAHIPEKVFKFHPPLTNSNTPSTVVLPPFAIFIKTTIFHSFPSFILKRFNSACLSMSLRAVTQLFYFKTAATSRLAPSQIVRGYSLWCSAIAYAVPICMLIPGYLIFGYQPKNGPPIESSSSQVNKFRHRRYNILTYWVVNFILIFLLAGKLSAATYYVDKNFGGASDALDCRSTSTPCLTIAGGISKMGSGDTLNIRAGTYTEGIDSSQLAGKSGSGSGNNYTSPTTIQGYQNETVTLRPSSGPCGAVICISTLTGAGNNLRYFVFARMVLDGVNAGGVVVTIGGGNNGGAVDHIKFDTVDAKNGTGGDAGGSVFYMGGQEGTTDAGSSIWLTNSKIHDNACGAIFVGSIRNVGHGVYVETPNNIVENTEIYNITGVGIHQYSGNPTGSDYHGNYIHNTGLIQPTNGSSRCRDEGASAVYLSTAGSGKFYNNKLVDNQNGLNVHQDSPNNVIYSNTFYRTGNGAVTCIFGGDNWCDPVVSIASGSTGNLIRNNVSFTASNNSFVDPNGGDTLSNNACSSGCTVDTDAYSVGQLFTNASAGNFTPLGPLLNAGFALGAPYNVDIANIARPQGADYDIGAYEYATPLTVGDQLVLALPLDDSGEIATDVSGQKNNGNLVGGAIWDNAGKYGKAISLDGTGYINVPVSPSLNLTSGMTLDAWVYPTVDPAGRFFTVIWKDRYYLYASSESGYCGAPTLAPIGGYSTLTNGIWICATSIPSINQWSHLAITYDGSSLTFYINGNIVASQPATDPMVPTNYDLSVGGNILYGEYFTGKIDEVRVYNYSRTPQQILSDMNTPLIGVPGKTFEIAAPVSVEISSGSSLEISAD